jgi:hypothetical protein
MIYPTVFDTKNSAVESQRFDFNPSRKVFDRFYLVPVVAVKGAVVTVDIDQFGFMIEKDRVDVNRLIELNLCGSQIDEMDYIWHDLTL